MITTFSLSDNVLFNASGPGCLDLELMPILAGSDFQITNVSPNSLFMKAPCLATLC